MKRIALIGENSVEYVSALLDIWNFGNCAVLIDWRIPISTACEMMADAGTAVCYIEKKRFNDNIKLDYPDIEFIEFESSISSAAKLPTEIYSKFRNNYSTDEAVIIYSSGTTGNSKGVILSHYAINSNAEAIQDYMKLTSNDCIYISKSLSHSSTLTGELLVALKFGIDLVLAPTVVPPRFVFGNIVNFKVTTLFLNPALLRMYSEEYQRKNFDISSLKTIYVSGSILNDTTYRMSHTVFGEVNIYNVYGLSEAGPRVTAQRCDCCKSNSVGKPIKGVKIAVVSNDGRVQPRGKHGVIHVKSRYVFDGYVSGKKKSESLYKNWLNTGDVGYIDEAGEVHIVDRVDNVIIIDAHKLYPSDIENRILKNEHVYECAVVQANHKNKGVLCCLYVGDVMSGNDIQRQLQQELISYEIPKLFFRMDELPKNNNGKRDTVKIKNLIQTLTDQFFAKESESNHE